MEPEPGATESASAPATEALEPSGDVVLGGKGTTDVATSPQAAAPTSLAPPAVIEQPVFELQATNVTVVRTTLELQRALDKDVVDIEIAEHLDLRNLKFTNNPALSKKVCRNGGLGKPGGGCEYLLHLDGTRSIRGNCKGPPTAEAAEAFQLPADTVKGVQQLAAGQCVLIINKPTFQAVAGNKWFQNLHITILQDFLTPEVQATAISVAPFQREAGMNLFLTDMTFQGAGPGVAARAVAVDTDLTDIDYNMGRLVRANFRHSILVQGSKFINFGGSTPPLFISSESFATFQKCSFQNFDLTREIFDVSFGGMLKLQSCSFKDINLRSPKRKLVSTTANNYIPCAGAAVDPSVDISDTPQAIFFNYPSDDDAYDIIPTLDNSDDMSQGFTVEDGTMSDCLRLQYTCPQLAIPIISRVGAQETAPPGCPLTSIDKRIQMFSTRCASDFFYLDPSVTRVFTGGGNATDGALRRENRDPSTESEDVPEPPGNDSTVGAVDSSLVLQLDPEAAAAEEARAATACIGYGNDGGDSFTAPEGFVYGFADENHPWLAAINKVLPEYSHANVEPWSWPSAFHNITTSADVTQERLPALSNTSTPPSTSAASNSNLGAVIGAAVGGTLAALALLIAACLVYKCIIRKRKRGGGHIEDGSADAKLQVDPLTGKGISSEEAGEEGQWQSPSSFAPLARISESQKLDAEDSGKGAALSSRSSASSSVQSATLNFLQDNQASHQALPQQQQQQAEEQQKDGEETSAEIHEPVSRRSSRSLSSPSLSALCKEKSNRSSCSQLSGSVIRTAHCDTSKSDMGKVLDGFGRVRSGGDSSGSRIETASSWLKMFPAMFQKKQHSAESAALDVVQVESVHCSTDENTFRPTDDAPDMPKGFSKAYNGLPMEENVSNQRAASDCIVLLGRGDLQPHIERANTVSNFGTGSLSQQFSKKWGKAPTPQPLQSVLPSSRDSKHEENADTTPPPHGDLVSTTSDPDDPFMSVPAAGCVTPTAQPASSDMSPVVSPRSHPQVHHTQSALSSHTHTHTHTTTGTASFISAYDESAHDESDDGADASADIGSDSTNSGALSTTDEYPMAEEGEMKQGFATGQSPLANMYRGLNHTAASCALASGTGSGPRGAPRGPASLPPPAQGPRSLTNAPSFLTAKSPRGPRSMEPRLPGPSSSSYTGMAPSIPKVPSAPHIVPVARFPEGYSSFHASERSDVSETSDSEESDLLSDGSPQSVLQRPATRAEHAQHANPAGYSSRLNQSEMSRVQSGNASSAGVIHHMMVDHFGDSEFNGGVPLMSIPVLPVANIRGTRNKAAQAHAVGGQVEALGQMGGDGSPTLALSGGGSRAESQLGGMDSLWSECTMRVEALMNTLIQQLGRFGPSDVLLGEFQLLGPQARRKGGQAVVQFARRADNNREYAIKFFLDPDAFYAEAKLYATFVPSLRGSISQLHDADAAETMDALETYETMTGALSRGKGDTEELTLAPHEQAGCACPTNMPNALRSRTSPLTKLKAESKAKALEQNRGIAYSTPHSFEGGSFLPRIEAIYDVGAKGLQDPQGQRMPPCIVMERGESLQEVVQRAEVDRYTALSVLSDTSACMAEMHEAGYAHRDIKPANIVWLPRENRWSLIDFGCAARIGGRAPLTFSLTYAAPEVLHAAELNAEVVEVFPEVDVWAFGVMAFELLTGVPTYHVRTHGVNKVTSCLRGDEVLPWEGQMSQQVINKLGSLRNLILAMLHRDPSLRPSMADFSSMLQSLM